MKTPLQILILFAFLMQAMIPLGFMPNLSTQNGGTALVICSGNDQKTIFVDAQGNQTDHQDHPALEKPCPYAVLAFFDTPAEPVSVTAQAAYASLTFQISESQSFAFPSHLRPYAAGPPDYL